MIDRQFQRVSTRSSIVIPQEKEKEKDQSNNTAVAVPGASKARRRAYIILQLGGSFPVAAAKYYQGQNNEKASVIWVFWCFSSSRWVVSSGAIMFM